MVKKLSGLLTLLLILGLLYYLFPVKTANSLVTPYVYSEKLAANLWFPQAHAQDVYPDAPTITSKSAYFVDLNTGQVLFQKNSHTQLPIASLTKIMTAIVALEHKRLSDVYEVSNRASEMEPDHMLLIANEKLSLEELLDGLFLVSANDAAE